MNYLRECLYDVAWQSLRVKFTGKWQHNNGVLQCCTMLKYYWEALEPDKPERVWRALSTLRAIKLGWTQKGGCPSEDALAMVDALELRLELVHKKLQADPETDLCCRTWDWDKVAKELRLLGRRTFNGIVAATEHRVRTAERHASAKYVEGADWRADRPELAYFFALLDIEQRRRAGNLPPKCLVKIAERNSPYMKEFRGYRVLTAIPNLAGTKPFTSEKAPSFDKPYLIAMFGDYETDTVLQEALAQIPKEMARRGFDQVEFVE